MANHTPLSPEEIETFLADLDDIDEQEGVSSLLTELSRRALLDLKELQDDNTTMSKTASYNFEIIRILEADLKACREALTRAPHSEGCGVPDVVPAIEDYDDNPRPCTCWKSRL